MDNLERKLQELENSISDAESKITSHSANMDGSNDDSGKASGATCFPYVYIVGALIPVLAAAALYFAKPKWVQKKEKGKMVICYTSLAKWVAIITAIGWVGLYLVNYCGAFGGAQACLSK